MEPVIDKNTERGDKHWYALYTRSRYEKKIASWLENLGYEVYLPIQKVLKQWSDRKKWVEEPLLRSYVFIRISESEYFNILNTPGVVSFVRTAGKLAVIPDKQIETLKIILESGEELELTDEVFEPGDYVKIIKGPLKGVMGTLKESLGKYKLVISIDGIEQALLLNISASMVMKA